MVESAWLNEEDMIVPKIFVNEHTEGKCIPTAKVREAFDKVKERIGNSFAFEDFEKELGL